MGNPAIREVQKCSTALNPTGYKREMSWEREKVVSAKELVTL